MCAIFHSYLPDRVPYDSLSFNDKKRNFSIAFSAAESVGISTTLVSSIFKLLIRCILLVIMGVPNGKSLYKFQELFGNLKFHLGHFKTLSILSLTKFM